MRFENHFDVGAPIEKVWDTILDVQRVAPNVPGAQVLEQTGDNAYKVAIKVKVGPMSMTYRGDIEVVQTDEATHRAVMRARAKESRGQGTANADVTMELSGDDGGTAATVLTDVQLTGRVATMGRGVLQDVSGRLVATFAENLAAMLEGRQPEAPATPAAPAAPAAEATAAQPAAAAPPPAREPEEALDLGAMGGQMIASQLRDPRRLGGVVALIALIAFLLGRRSAR